MAISILQVDSGHSGSNVQPSFSISMAHPSGTNRLLVVGAASRMGAGQIIDKVSLSHGIGPPEAVLIGDQDNNTSSPYISLWYFTEAQISGSSWTSIVVTASSSVRMAAGAIWLDGVDQTSPVRGFAGNYSSNGGNPFTEPHVSLGSIEAGDMVIDAVAMNDGAVDADPLAATKRYSERTTFGTSSGNVRCLGSSIIAAATSQLMRWDDDSHQWVIGVVAIKPHVEESARRKIVVARSVNL